MSPEEEAFRAARDARDGARVVALTHASLFRSMVRAKGLPEQVERQQAELFAALDLLERDQAAMEAALERWTNAMDGGSAR